jgi:outer membrane protein assembly factor BamE (lipoprotein component of BamABCDE complex)
MRFSAATIILLACLTVVACSLQRAETAQHAQTQMVGMSKEQVLQCMGPPLQKTAEGQTEVWLYGSGNGRTTVSYGNGVAIGTQRFCSVNVVMIGGRVSAVNYSCPTGGLLSRGEQCAFAIQNCVQ